MINNGFFLKLKINHCYQREIVCEHGALRRFAAFVEREMKQEITCSSPAHSLTRFGNLWQDHLSDGTSTQIGNGQSIGYVLWEGKHWTQYSQGCYSKQPCTTSGRKEIQGVTSNERYRGIN